MSDIKTVSDGTVLLHEGKKNASAFLILSGKVAVTRGEQDILLAELTEGEVFGEMSLIDASLCSATVTAMGDVEVQVFTKDNFVENMQQDSVAMQAIMGSMFQRMRTMNKRVVDLESQMLELTQCGNLSSSNVLLKGLTEPARHATYDMAALVVDEFPYQIGRWSKQQSKTSWFSNKKVKNHISIRDIPPYVTSREHCRLEKKNDGVYLVDLKSRLGTWVNGTKVGGGENTKARLNSGSNTIYIGTLKSPFAFEVIIP